MAEERTPKVNDWVYFQHEGKLVHCKISRFGKKGSKLEDPEFVRLWAHTKYFKDAIMVRTQRLKWRATLGGWYVQAGSAGL